MKRRHSTPTTGSWAGAQTDSPGSLIALLVEMVLARSTSRRFSLACETGLNIHNTLKYLYFSDFAIRFWRAPRSRTITMSSHFDSPLAGANPLSSERMSPGDRLAEIGRILAAGVVRLEAGKASPLSAEPGDCFVDFRPRKSGARRGKRIRIGGIHEASQ